MSQTRENETGRGPAFWYEPAVSGRTIVDDALSTPHPRAGRRQPVRTPAGHLSTAENGQEPPEGKTPATRENAETAYGKRYVDAVEEQPSPGSGNAHAQRLLELVNPLMTVFMEGCRVGAATKLPNGGLCWHEQGSYQTQGGRLRCRGCGSAVIENS